MVTDGSDYSILCTQKEFSNTGFETQTRTNKTKMTIDEEMTIS